jgi:hypothetical protein
LHVDLDLIRPDLVAEIVEARGAHALGLDDVKSQPSQAPMVSKRSMMAGSGSNSEEQPG